MRLKSWIVAGIIGVSGTAGLGLVVARAIGGASCCAPRAAGATTATVTIHVDGVTCASCAVGIRKALKKLDGVATVTIDETTARVAYDPAKIAPPQIVAAIDKLGYKARIA